MGLRIYLSMVSFDIWQRGDWYSSMDDGNALDRWRDRATALAVGR